LEHRDQKSAEEQPGGRKASRSRATRSFRLHIGLLGRRNVGKSSLINALMGQDVAIVSDTPGTTTDPVTKPMELQPIGPVLLIDTAGLDDSGDLGTRRIERTRAMLDRCDIVLLVVGAGAWSSTEEALLADLKQMETPVIVVCNQADRQTADSDLLDTLTRDGVPVVHTVAPEKQGLAELRQAIIAATPGDFLEPTAMVSDLVGPGELAVLVVPIDMEAPRGRLIMPQVQAIRDLLDGDAMCMVVKERELGPALANLKQPPKLVVTDSQAFLKVAADTPPEVALTSFSILMARFRGDLSLQVVGAAAIDRLQAGDRVLIAEACSHHPLAEDIGRVKLPQWLTRYLGGALQIEHAQGHDFPADLADFKLVIHCGACTMNRREVLSRLQRCRDAGVPVTNYGLAIAFSLGIFDRALVPFPAARDAYLQLRETP